MNRLTDPIPGTAVQAPQAKELTGTSPFTVWRLESNLDLQGIFEIF